jgi:hypothetical protein
LGFEISSLIAGVEAESSGADSKAPKSFQSWHLIRRIFFLAIWKSDNTSYSEAAFEQDSSHPSSH